jgi:hypothetical protein
MTVGPHVAAVAFVFTVPVASEPDVPLAAARAIPTAAAFPVELPLELDPAAAMITLTSTIGKEATMIGLDFRGMPCPPNAVCLL